MRLSLTRFVEGTAPERIYKPSLTDLKKVIK